MKISLISVISGKLFFSGSFVIAKQAVLGNKSRLGVQTFLGTLLQRFLRLVAQKILDQLGHAQ